MSVIIYCNSDFANKTKEQIESWVLENFNNLVGSAVFTKNNSITSKLVRWAESWREKNKKQFIPSHTGSIVEKDGKILLFDMKPPKSRVTLLVDYLCTTKDTFMLLLRDYKINTGTFNALILDRVGEWYPYMSAVRSVFTKRRSKYRQHCSEHFARTTVLSGHGFSSKFNLECTPLELFKEMIKDERK